MTRSKPTSRRPSTVHTLDLLTSNGRIKLHVTLGCYPDSHRRAGDLCEVFVDAGKTGSFTKGALDQAARAWSRELQRGCPASELASHLRGTRGMQGFWEADGGRVPIESAWDAIGLLIERECCE